MNQALSVVAMLSTIVGTFLQARRGKKIQVVQCSTKEPRIVTEDSSSVDLLL